MTKIEEEIYNKFKECDSLLELNKLAGELLKENKYTSVEINKPRALRSKELRSAGVIPIKYERFVFKNIPEKESPVISKIDYNELFEIVS